MVQLESLGAVSYSHFIVTMSVSSIVSNMKRDIGLKSQFFHTPCAFNVPVRGRSPYKYRHKICYGKTITVALSDGKKVWGCLLVSVQYTNVMDTEPDKRTHRHRATQTPRDGIGWCIASRGKKSLYAEVPPWSPLWELTTLYPHICYSPSPGHCPQGIPQSEICPLPDCGYCVLLTHLFDIIFAVLVTSEGQYEKISFDKLTSQASSEYTGRLLVICHLCMAVTRLPTKFGTVIVTFFEIQSGGCRHLGFSCLSEFCMFCHNGSLVLELCINLVKIFLMVAEIKAILFPKIVCWRHAN